MSDDWTFLVYVAADDENTSGARSTVSALLEASLPPGVHVAMQVDLRNRETKRVLRAANKSVDSSVGRNVNTGGPRALREFLEWGITECPSNKTCLIAWGHGNGILGSLPSSRPARGDEPRTDDALTNRELRKVLREFARASGTKMDVVALHACLMGTVEVSFELSEASRFFVASEDDAKQSAWPYADIFANLGEARAVARSIVLGFGAQTASGIFAAFDQSKLDKLASSVGSLGEALCTMADDAEGRRATQAARDATIALSDPNYVDLASALEELSSLPSAKVRAAAANARTALNEAVIERASVGQVHERMGGLSIFFPSAERARSLLPLYTELEMSKKHRGWSTFLDMFVGGGDRR